MGKSNLEMILRAQLNCEGIKFEEEYKFHPTRRWRFDFAIPEKKIAIEAEGGVWSGGRHTTGSGFTKDLEKYGEALILGWKVLRCTGSQIESGQCIDWLKQIL